MAQSVNKTILIGNVGRKPALHQFDSGQKVVNFPLATTKKWSKHGHTKEFTEWHYIAVYGEKLCDMIVENVEKGDRIYVEGELKYKKLAKDGKEERRAEITIEGYGGTIVLLKDKRTSAPGDYSHSRPNRQKFDDEEIF